LGTINEVGKSVAAATGVEGLVSHARLVCRVSVMHAQHSCPAYVLGLTRPPASTGL